MSLPYSAEIWLQPYVKDRLQQLLSPPPSPRRAWVAITDHYEPFWQNKDEQLARQRVAEWRLKWPQIAARHRDSTGKPPQYCFFYPQEEYRPHLMESLAEMARGGIADVEIHLHHDGEGQQDFLDRMNSFRETLFHKHGLLRKKDGNIAFGFIHGNWALDNSRDDGLCCGLNNEIQLLRDLGCYADFTMPCGTASTQAKTLNKIYWANDDICKPKSYDRGIEVVAGRLGTGDLLMITGPFGLLWKSRLRPGLEIGELAGYAMPTPYRVKRWFDLSPRIGKDVFIKLFAHGTQERNAGPLLDVGLDAMFSALHDESARRGIELRYVTAWDMYRAVLSAAGGAAA